MLNIFYGRESIDKEKFIFNNMSEKALLLVPDQFTLNAEKAVIEQLNLEGLMDIEIIGLSRLGHKILAACGGGKQSFIDTHGRHMIISGIVNKREKELLAFSKMSSKVTFVQLLNDFISEMKQFGMGLEDIKQLADECGENKLLKSKLLDIALIYQEYEERIKGKYVDSEDYIDLFLPKISKAKLVKGRDIWLWGFDWLSPKVSEVIIEMSKSACVNLVMTYSKDTADSHIFEITDSVIYHLEEMAKESSIEYCKIAIDDEYLIPTGTACGEKNIALAELERGLFKIPSEMASEQGIDAAHQGSVIVARASNWHSEAENAAAYILWLLREKNLRLKDISIICNDLSMQGKLVERVFAESGIEIFSDQKRNIMHHPAVAYLVSLIDIMTSGYSLQNIMALLKTGYSGLSENDVEVLENYAIEYKINNATWKEPFTKGVERYGEEGAAFLEKCRKEVISPLILFEEEFKQDRSVMSRTEALYGFLVNEAGLPDRLQATVDRLLECNLIEAAEETLQIWDSIVLVLQQLCAVLSEEKVSLELYRNILIAGLSAVEIGLLPPTVDGLVMGTLQRSRRNNVRALVVIGASEGNFPKDTPSQNIISEAEKKAIAEKGKVIGKLDSLRAKEERLAMYKSLCAPLEYLYVSYGASDSQGKKQRPSMVWQDIKNFFRLEAVTDVSAAENDIKMLYSPGSALRYAAQRIEEAKEGGEINPVWQEVLNWYKLEKPEMHRLLMKGTFSKIGDERLNERRWEELYRRNGDYRLSPSALEKYSKCPFSHYVSYGLRPEERRIFSLGSREIGDISHECIMEFCKSLTEKDIVITGENSKWMTVSEAECKDIIEKIFTEVCHRYREGLANKDKEENYKSGRIKDVIFRNCWALVNHVRAGKIESMLFEEAFGFNKKIAPIEIDLGQNKFYIEGKIDRLDYLQNGTVKVIDYKSSDMTIKKEEITGGWKLQLMLYLQGALEDRRKPAGIFYYNVKDQDISGDGISKEKLKEKVTDLVSEFKMNGILIDSGENTREILGEFTGYSDIVAGIKNSKSKEEPDTMVISGNALMREEEYEEFKTAFNDMIKELCKSLIEGEIGAKPKKAKDLSACTYCQYKSICGFDVLISGCSYKRVQGV